MRRALTSLFLTAAIVWVNSHLMLAQRGGGHGSSGGHASGFSSGGFGTRGFGSSFGGSYLGSTPRSFPAPRMNFQSGSSAYNSYARPYAAYQQRSWPVARSPFGQLSAPTVSRAPYPGALGSRSWNGYPSHGGYPNGRRVYRSSYGYGYISPFYSGLVTGWIAPWPYFGNWDDISGTSDTGPAPDQSYAAEQQPPYEPENEAPMAYQAGYPSATETPASEPALTIVYKDGHSQQVHNYALTPTTLLLLDDAASGRTQQVSLEEINLPATQAANRAAGVDFSLPVRN
jgi:hypothetical protein